MNCAPIIKREVTYPHLLTEKARKIAEGKTVNNITDKDWESYLDYIQRVEIVELIVNKQFK